MFGSFYRSQNHSHFVTWEDDLLIRATHKHGSSSCYEVDVLFAMDETSVKVRCTKSQINNIQQQCPLAVKAELLGHIYIYMSIPAVIPPCSLRAYQFMKSTCPVTDVSSALFVETTAAFLTLVLAEPHADLSCLLLCLNKNGARTCHEESWPLRSKKTTPLYSASHMALAIDAFRLSVRVALLRIRNTLSRN